MNEPDSRLTEHDGLGPAPAGFLEKFELSQVVNPEHWSGFTLTLQLRPSGESDSPCLHLEFHQVQELRLGPLDGLLCYFIEIRSITERQLEDRRYYVVESDHGAFSFYCRSYYAAYEGKQP